MFANVRLFTVNWHTQPHLTHWKPSPQAFQLLEVGISVFVSHGDSEQIIFSDLVELVL